MFFYLKVNLIRSFTIKNVQHWVDAIGNYPGAKIFFVCDNQDLKARIQREIKFPCEYSFVQSWRNDQHIKSIVDGACVEEWKNAGIAHLTTFFHALEQGENKFWNIDADDTRFCFESYKLCDMFKKVEEKCLRNAVDMSSLDFYYTASFGYGWSFGITYVNDAAKSIEAAKEMVGSEMWKEVCRKGDNLTIDAFYRFIKNRVKTMKLNSFYVDNSVFIHYSDDWLYAPGNGINCFFDGILFRPLIYFVLGARSESVYFIPCDVEKVDVGASIHECTQYIRNQTKFGIADKESNLIMNDFMPKEIANMKDYMKDHKICSEARTIIWGIGEYLRTNYPLVRACLKNIIGYSDNNQEKWGGYHRRFAMLRT